MMRRLRHTSLSLLAGIGCFWAALAFLQSGPAWAGLNEGVAALERGDYAVALREFRTLAERGDARAQFHLGHMYSEGHGVLKDDQEAIKWVRRAAEQGDATAEFMLGLMYQAGTGVPQDAREAVQWYRRAAERGDVRVQLYLGHTYSRDHDVPKDDREAVKWYRRAAEQGDATAEFMLGLMYQTGTGVPQDYVQAHFWLNLAAAQGFGDAGKWRDRVANHMTPAQIAEAQHLAREWRPRPETSSGPDGPR